MSKVIKHFFSVINTKTFVVIAAACATTYLCTELEFHYNVPTDLIGIAIVFPIVFSINAAYSRREKALEHYSVFKGSALSIRYAHMHWIDENQKENRQEKKINGDEHVNRIDTIYKELFDHIYRYLHSTTPNPETYDHIIKLKSNWQINKEQEENMIKTLRRLEASNDLKAKTSFFMIDFNSSY